MGRAAVVPDVLRRAAEEAPDQVIVHIRGDGGERVVTYRALWEESLRVAGGLLDAGLTPGSPVPLIADRSDDFQPLFWGILAAGLLPVPLAPDKRRVLPVWEFLGRPPVAVDTATAPLLAALGDGVRPLPLDELREGRPPVALPVRAPDDVAFLQFSSGSTGAPKGVELTHAGVLANLEQIRAATQAGPDDVVVSWMPYFHDMGLIGTHLAPLAARIKQVRLGPLSFAKRPALWLETAARHRATVLCAANFALALVERRVPEETLARLDLTSVRLVLVGAEPISPAVWRAFARRMSVTGLAARALQPVYGLAEATLAVTMPPPGEVAEPLVLDRAELGRGRAVDAGPGAHAVELMPVGRPVPGCEVRIVDDAGAALGDRRVGHIVVRGPQLGRGYHRAPEETAAAFGGGWLRTGDLGFLDRGRLCVTGRFKDVVFVNGTTYHAADLEEVAAGTPGLPRGPVAVVGSADPSSGRERVVVFVPAKAATAAGPSGTGGRGGVAREVAARVGAAIGHDDVRVVALSARAFPRTTSGKLRRGVMRERFEAGAYAEFEVFQATAAADGRERGPGTSEPRSRREVESGIRGIWARVLGLPATGIGPDDRFFALGGSSIKAMEVLAAVEDEFGVSLRPADVRDHDTVAGLAGLVLAGGGRGEEPERRDGDPGGPVIAVTAMACRFPGADTPEAFWDLLVRGRDVVGGVPAGRWADPAGSAGRWGAFLDDPAAFDAGYFGIGEEEAVATDPQARIFLELAHEALERAGYAGPRRRGLRVGVFAAAGESGYRRLLEQAYGEAGPPASALIGTLGNMLAARVAHCLDLTGPALVVDTACSSALVALHLARRSLQQGECDVAVVGGVNLNLTPDGYASLEKIQALSPTGRCHTFGAAADGFVPGEGGAAVVLSRLDDAQRAGDPIVAVLLGTAVNNDGRSLSLMAPNPATQREVITQAYREAGVDPGGVSYVEAHGTGTAIGDPVEIASLVHAFPPRADGRPRLLGSVKTNIGHLLNSAGMPGLVKVLLALGHRRLPPSLHHAPSASALHGSGFEVVAEARDWDEPGPLIAGVNAFGFGGTNAHAILAEPPARRPSGASVSARPRLLTLSARSAPGLRAAAAELARHLREHPELDEGDVCAAVAAARDEGSHRLALVCDGDLAERLEAGPAGRSAGSRPRLVLLLPGQGAQRPGQGRALYADAPVFREVLEEASDLAGEIGGRSLSAWCLDPGVSPAELARTDIAQPLLVAYGVALARQMRAWGITPDAVAGHSVGEIAAACVAGRLTIGDAVRFAAERGRLMRDLCAPGTMAAVHAGEETVAELVAGSGGALSVAAINAPGRTVVAGTPQAVDHAVRELTGRGVAVRRLEVSHAFHSPLMDPALGPLAEVARAVTLHPYALPLISTVTAEWQPDLDPGYLREHAARPVRFGAAVERMLDDGYDLFLELGSGPVLSGAVREVAAGWGRTPVILANRGEDGVRGLLEMVGRLWEHGVSLDRTALDAGRARVAVPTYPFQRRRYWPTASPRRLLHRFVWEDAPLTGGPEPHTVLLAGPDCPLSRALADRLAGRDVAVLRDPIGERGPRPDVVVLFGGPAVEPDSADALEAAQLAMVRDLHGLLPRLAEDRSRVLVVTEDVHVTGEGAERPRPAQAVLTGLTSALPDELPGVEARSVDLSSLDDLAMRLSALDRELAARGGARREAVNAVTIAWRGGRRFGRVAGPVEAGAAVLSADGGGVRAGGGGRFGRVAGPVEAGAAVLSADGGGVRAGGGGRLGHVTGPIEAGAVALPAEGVYLITGGGGGIGGALARDLADRGRPTLVLIGRSPEPPAGLLADLRARGAVAEYRVADVAREADVDAVLADLPHLDAVFHAAGVVRPGTLRAKTVEEVAGNLAAKTRGSLLLARGILRHGLRPAICVAFSSVSSVLPGLAGALGDYAAANAFLDAFAAAERAAGRPWLALNLAAVAGTGVAAGLPAGGVSGLRPLALAEALGAVRDACGIEAAQVLIADLEPDPQSASRASGGPKESHPDAVISVSAPVSVAVSASQPRSVGSDRQAEDIADLLRRLVAAALRRPVDDIGDDEPFLGLGLDSLTAVDLVKRLERELGRSLPITLFFEHRTLRELAAHLQTGEPRQADALRNHDVQGDVARDGTFLDGASQGGSLRGGGLPGGGSHGDGALGASQGESLRGGGFPGGGSQDDGALRDRREAVTGDAFPLTPIQLAFHAQSRLYPDVAAFGYVRQTIEGPLDPELLGQALGHLSDRHPMLRLRVRAGGDSPVQIFVPSGDGATPGWYEVRPGVCADDEELAAIETALCNRPFDLATEAPIRALLVRNGADSAHLVVVVHHAAADGFSLNILNRELWDVYTALARGRTPCLPSLDATFRVYAARLRAERSEAAFRDDLAYWREVLARRGEPLALPYDGDPHGPPVAPLLAHQVAIGPDLSAALRDVAAAHGVSVFHLLLAAYLRCLSRWSGDRRDVAVNIARARRDMRLPGVEGIVGPLADTLPLLARVVPGESVHALAARLRDTWSVGERHARPTSLDLARLLPGRAAGPRTVSPASFSFARFPISLDPDCPVRVRSAAAGTASAATRLSLLCWESGDELHFSWNFPARLFERATIGELAGQHLAELAAAVHAPHRMREHAEPGAVASQSVRHGATHRAEHGAKREILPQEAVEPQATASKVVAAPVAAARDETARDETARDETARDETARKETARKETARDETARDETARDETARDETRSGGVVARLRAQVLATPDAIAVDTGEATMTYAQLDRVSAALASRLRAAGVAAGDLVGLLTEPGVDTVAGVVGILRAGAGWVPLDATYPPSRLAWQLARTGARVVVCHDGTLAAATTLADTASAALVAVDDRSPAPPYDEVMDITPEAVAYVIFTSGSTGRPKGVPITHRSMENYLDWALATFGYRGGDRLTQTASACFDASVRQILAPLLVGATVVTFPRHLVRDPEALLDRVEQGRITVWSSVPGLWSRLLDAAETRMRNGGRKPDLAALRWIHVGGEALPAAHVRRWYDLFGPGQRIANLYGPTEATINATFHIIDARPADDVRFVPIGRPIAGTYVEVVGPDGRRCEPGEPGELLISGVGLTPGYLGEPELTQAAFTERDGRRWYRSGDRVVRTPDGDLQFLGRLDDQVKVRGYRVEPGEIEAAAQTHPAVARAAVILRGDRLVAFVEPRPGASPPDAVDLRAYLAGMLPAYLLPSRIHVVDELPLTATGKIDRSGLGDLASRSADAGNVAKRPSDGDAASAAPMTPTETLLARIWAELLDVPSIGRDDDFFALGGDSILILQVFARLRDQIPALPRPTVVYAHPTLAALAAAVDRAGTEHGAPAHGNALGGDGRSGPTPFPLTPSQRGFLLAEAIAPDAPSTWPACVRVHGRVNRDAFQRAVDACVVRHGMLRTMFPAGARPPVQQELPPAVRIPVAFETLTDRDALPSRIADERARRFESWAWPLLRLRLITLAPDEHVLIVNAHHLIGDGYSVALLGRELLAAYDRLLRGDAAEPPPLRSTFRDHVALLERESATAGRRARFDIPYRRPVLGGTRDGSVLASAYRSAAFTLGPGRVAALRRMAREAGTTLFAPVLTAYYRALVAVTGQDDLILGLAVTGRDHGLPDAHLVFGPFAAAVPLRPSPPDGTGGRGTTRRAFADDLRRIAAEVAAARGEGGEGIQEGGNPPVAAQFFLTFLDFSALGPLKGDTLTLTWDDIDAESAPPPVGTDTFLAARPVGSGELRLALRASATAFTQAAFDAFARLLQDELNAAARPQGGTGGAARVLDAALIGYLPAPGHLAALAGADAGAWPRERLRSLLFPESRPRLVEEIGTPLGRSGFVCLPLFADELANTPDLAGRTAGAVEYAASLGARCVSLAGMIPSLTGYGFDVLRATGTTADITTGHAATVVSVVKTVHAALRRSGHTLDALTVAVVGLGSIGRASLELLLTLAARPPARLILCDVAGSGPRLAELAADLIGRGLAEAVETHESDPALPAAVYESGLIVSAVSGGGALLDIDRLRPGAIVVDDSFPHCFDTGKALARMTERRDALIVGGGLLAVRDVERRIAEGLPPAAALGYASQPWLPGTIASCRLESLLRAAHPDLPLVHGLVSLPPALAYWESMAAAGVDAGPLHLLGRTVDQASPAAPEAIG
ncbi:amino acid adenylation domain-containing protein [Thermopolyspora sp. NPDC052614]|uniref:non-ribosomal peptide synthetase/type I polyketide synthase n=1 Tax=Thermopolyspora sp. NPDC052614 TaxID=3155682 RepID=UPI0034420135